MPKRNAVSDVESSASASPPFEDDNLEDSIMAVVSVTQLEDFEEENFFGQPGNTKSSNTHTIVNFTEHAVSLEEAVLETNTVEKSRISSAASKSSFSSGGSGGTTLSSSTQSFSSVGSVACKAVGTTITTPTQETHKLTIVEIVKSIPSLFFGKKRPSFLLVLLVFISIAVSAPVASTLALVCSFQCFTIITNTRMSTRLGAFKEHKPSFKHKRLCLGPLLSTILL